MPQTPGSGKIKDIRRKKPANMLELLTDPQAEWVRPTSGGFPVIFPDRANDRGTYDRDTVMKSRADAAVATTKREGSLKGSYYGDMNQADTDAQKLPIRDAEKMARERAEKENEAYAYDFRRQKGRRAPLMMKKGK